MWKNSLKTKLVVSFVLISLIAVVVAGVSAVTSMREAVEQEVRNKLLLLAETKEGQISAYLDSSELGTLDFSSDVLISDNLAEKLNEIISSETLAVYLVDKEKKILAHGRKGTKYEIDTIDTLPVQQCLNNKEEIISTYTNHFGEEVIGASMCFPQRRWVLLTEINVKEAFAPVRDATYGLVIILVIILLFVILDIFLIAGNIIEPIKKLHEASDIIAQGNLDYKVDIKTNDEIEQLGDAFNQMAINLKKSRSELRQYSISLEEKIAERTKDLRNKVDELDAILHSIGDGVFVVDKDLKVIVVNKVAADMAGYKMEEILGTKYTEKLKFIYEGTEKINDEFVSRAIETKTIQEMSNHTALVDKAGNKIPVADSAAPLFDKDGEVIGCVVVFRDVTKERNIEKAKTDFLSLASHQLRTPLSGTKWLIETVQRGITGKMTRQQKEYLEQIYNINEQMIKLVFDILNVLRLESGAAVAQKEAIPVSKLYDNLVLMMEPAAKSRGVILKNILKNHKEVTVETDMLMLQNILESFVSNAISYSSPGQEVILGADDEVAAVIFFVKDSGIGIPKEEQERIREKFYRASNAKEFRPNGTGLGLYTASMLAEKIGAKISFESEKGKGSIFSLRVPKKVEKTI